MIKKVVNKTSLTDRSAARRDPAYWLGRPLEERVAAVDYLRRQYHGSSTRLQRSARIVQQASGWAPVGWGLCIGILAPLASQEIRTCSSTPRHSMPHASWQLWPTYYHDRRTISKTHATERMILPCKPGSFYRRIPAHFSMALAWPAPAVRLPLLHVRRQ